KPTVCRQAVGLVQAELKLSQRQACRALGLSRSIMRYRSVRPVPTKLLEQLKALASRWPRRGYRYLWRLLRRDGHLVNHKRVYRLYQAEGLAVRTRRRKRLAATPRLVMPPPTRPNERWSMDFVSDVTESGRKLRVFAVVDDFTRRCVALEVDTSFSGGRLARILRSLGTGDALRPTLVSDNGPEFTSKAMDKWASANRVPLHVITPGKPVENAFVESFNGRLRDECLNTQWFADLEHARRVIAAWRDLPPGTGRIPEHPLHPAARAEALGGEPGGDARDGEDTTTVGVADTAGVPVEACELPERSFGGPDSARIPG
ncbi:MAG TPA: IS3 family transposase, partial [Myxococcaceae bacterium]|nr:IS3 family transposase [Myxococcaceae bacterium]